MSYAVTLSERAKRDLRKLAAAVRERIVRGLGDLPAQPRNDPNVTKMVGADTWRLRVGDYRVVFDIDDAARLLTVIRIGHRREIYRR